MEKAPEWRMNNEGGCCAVAFMPQRSALMEPRCKAQRYWLLLVREFCYDPPAAAGLRGRRWLQSVHALIFKHLLFASESEAGWVPERESGKAYD